MMFSAQKTFGKRPANSNFEALNARECAPHERLF
jgi:hypothetical protein